ncbi:PLD-like domain protein [Leptospira ryugenii]|uniref:phospholipase D n=1 Tax=Leptospira ryugenii TaxID=1917863 RepID=A0A2P2DVU6_9LEPT|nr:phospholipase D-like domain-containing protein [Leptospira ryugenii]GBF48761.1 PLD-like domain protein [Leptospira ryugenii]
MNPVVFFTFILFLLTNCKNADTGINPDILTLINPGTDSLFFTNPGRDVPDDTKNKVKRLLLNDIDDSKHTITGFVYGLNDLDIILALKKAKQKGISIEIQGDQNEDYSLLTSYSIPIKKWSKSSIHHTKIWLFDEKIAFLGSGNFTASGLLQDNNVFWKKNLHPQEFQKLVSVLRQTDPSGTVSLGKEDYYFAPESGLQIQNTILEQIRLAKNHIRMLIFTHFDPVISHELAEACRRGVRVEAIYNQNPLNDEAIHLSKSLLPHCKVYADGNRDVTQTESGYRGGLMHHKAILIDEESLLLGSYNFTVSARDENREFFVRKQNKKEIQEFMDEWKRLLGLAEPLPEKSIAENPKLFVTTFLGQTKIHIVFSCLGGDFAFDRNSSALGKELFNSLGSSWFSNLWQNTNCHSNRGAYFPISLPNQFGVLTSPSARFQAISFRFLWDRIQIFPKDQSAERILVWDAKSLPREFAVNSDQEIDLNLSNYLKGDAFYRWEGREGAFHFCTKRKGFQSPNWIRFLLWKLYPKLEVECIEY